MRHLEHIAFEPEAYNTLIDTMHHWRTRGRNISFTHTLNERLVFHLVDEHDPLCPFLKRHAPIPGKIAKRKLKTVFLLPAAIEATMAYIVKIEETSHRKLTFTQAVNELVMFGKTFEKAGFRERRRPIDKLRSGDTVNDTNSKESEQK